MKPANWFANGLLGAGLLLAQPLFGQSPADSIRLFQRPAVKIPAVKLTGIEQFRISFQPAGLLSPEIRLFGPSDLLPVLRPRFLPAGDWWISALASPDGSLSGRYFMNFPNGEHLLTVSGLADYVKEKNVNHSQQSGFLRIGNRQTGMGSRLPDWYYLFQAGIDRREFDGIWMKKTTQSQTLHSDIRWFSDPDAGADNWSFGASAWFHSMEKEFVYSPAFIHLSGSWNPDLTIGTWLNNGEWETGSGDIAGFERATALSGLQFSGEGADLSLSMGFSRLTDSLRSDLYPSGTMVAGLHGVHWHLLFDGSLNTTGNQLGEIMDSEFWYLDYSNLPPFYRMNYSGALQMQWFPDMESQRQLTIRLSERADYYLVTDSLISSGPDLQAGDFVLQTEDHFSNGFTLKSMIYGQLPMGIYQSIPWHSMASVYVSGSGFVGETRLTGEYNWRTERYQDTKKQRKLTDLHEISLLLEDFRWKSLNLFAEFKIIMYEADQTLPGLKPETFRFMAGMRYHF